MFLFSSTVKQTSAAKKDQHRHSLDGYDLNNVAGMLKGQEYLLFILSFIDLQVLLKLKHYRPVR